VQLGTVRFLGTFLARPAEVPQAVAARVAEELRVDPGCLVDYTTRQPTHREHAGEIQREYGYRDFSEASAQAELSAWLDARAEQDQTLDWLVTAFEAAVQEAARRNGLAVELDGESRSPAVRFDQDLTARLDACLRANGLEPAAVGTAAGHDAGALAAAVPTAMLFVRNPTGTSHSPEETAELDDCLAGVRALATVIEELACR